MTPDSATTICVVAFAGDAAALSETLGQCATASSDTLLILASGEDALLLEVARQAGCRLEAALPSYCDSHRYWCVVTAALNHLAVDCCWVVRAGTSLPTQWQRRLGMTDMRCAALFPLSIRHPCTSIFSRTDHAPGLPLEQLDRWLNNYLTDLTWDIPLLDGQTALIRPAAFPAGAEDDRVLAERVRQGGHTLLATDSLLVDDRQLAPAQFPQMLGQAWREAVLFRHPLTAVRHAMSELSGRGEPPPATVPATLPAVLHVCHGWGGGLWHWVQDFVSADEASVNYVLKPIGDWQAFGQTLALYLAADLERPLATWTLALPIVSTAISHFEYRSLLQEIIDSYCIETVLVSSLIGHAMDVLRTSLPTLLVVHDFYPVCPPVVATWEKACDYCDSDRLAACLRDNPGHRFFTQEDEPHWQALRAAYVADLLHHRPLVVVPSQSVATRLKKLQPALDALPMRVIPHGLPPCLLNELTPVVPESLLGRRPRVVVLGSLEVHKGGALLREMVEPLTAIADLYLLGCGDAGDDWESRPQVTVQRQYQRDELGSLLRELRPDVGLLLSVVPETFSYTLSELQAAAVPPVATGVGAFSDRIIDGESGWLVAPDADALLLRLRALFADPRQLAAVRNTLATLPRRSTSDMVQDYQALMPAQKSLLRRPLRATDRPRDLESAVVKIDSDARFRRVLYAVLGYLRGKTETSPRLPEFSRRPLRSVIDWLRR